MKKPIIFIVGSSLLVVGLTLILMWWPEVVSLVRGGAGIALALGGLVTLYSIKG